MSYQIEYSSSNIVKKPVPIKKRKLGALISVVAVLLVAGLLQIETVQNFLIPGDAEVTKTAFYTFTQALEEGEPFPDAAAAFCRQLIERDAVA